MTIRFSVFLCLSLPAVSTLCFAQAPALPAAVPVVTSRLDAVRMLRGREFDRLDRAIRSLQEAVERDVQQELPLANAMSAFDSTDPAMTALIQEWLKAKPDSYAAHLAYAEHAETLAWAARGDDWSDRTSADQITQMKYHLGRLVLEAEAALRINPRLAYAVGLLISSAKATNGDDCVRLLKRHYDVIGASVTARMKLAHCLLPRWGGSYAALEALVDEAESFVAANPRLSILAGLVSWDRGSAEASDDRVKATQLYTEALRHGTHPWFLLSRSRMHFDRRRHTEAVADIEQVLQDSPHHTEALMLRAWNLINLGRSGDAAADVRLVRELNPLDEMLADFREQEIDEAVATARHRIRAGDDDDAAKRLTEALALVGDDAELLYWRGRTGIESGNHLIALPDLQRAVQLDPRHFDAIESLDYILTAEGQYQSVVQHWSAYLTLEPGNAKALLARARAYAGRGEVPPAAADAKTACAAGLTEACLLAATLPR